MMRSASSSLTMLTVAMGSSGRAIICCTVALMASAIMRMVLRLFIVRLDWMRMS